MRMTWISCALTLACCTQTVKADDLAHTSAGMRSQSRRQEQTHSPTAQELIHQRAAYRARNRIALLEARRWYGITPERPYIGTDVYRTNLNPGYGWNGLFTPF